MANFNTHLRKDQILDALSRGLSSVQPDDLSTVATSGQYADLLGKPVIDESPTKNSDNLVSSGGVANAIAHQIDNGAKNRLTINSGSNTPPSQWTDIPVSVSAGTYHLFFGSITSDDIDADTCQIIVYDASNTQVSNTIQMQRGNNVSTEVTISGETSYLRIYASRNTSLASGDTVTFSNVMLCTADDWAISQKYVPYCPTVSELYRMILDLGGGSSTA